MCNEENSETYEDRIRERSWSEECNFFLNIGGNNFFEIFVICSSSNI